MLRAKVVKHVKGGNQKFKIYKYLVKHVIRAVGLRIVMIWLSKNGPQGR